MMLFYKILSQDNFIVSTSNHQSAQMIRNAMIEQIIGLMIRNLMIEQIIGLFPHG